MVLHDEATGPRQKSQYGSTGSDRTRSVRERQLFGQEDAVHVPNGLTQRPFALISVYGISKNQIAAVLFSLVESFICKQQQLIVTLRTR